jgi:hypothetical protein
VLELELGRDLRRIRGEVLRVFVPKGLMIVARQFIAWYPWENGNRPVGYGMIEFDRRATIKTINQPRARDQTVPL